jgi:choloylglycine hydrolase
MRKFMLVATALVLLAADAYPCSTFCLVRDDEVLFGRNYDFEIGPGYAMTNRRGLQKTSMAGTLRWTSRYGSVTFNQWGREFPMDGMNDAGLVVALMWLDETVYPRDERPALRVLEWIQYQLDNYGSVADVLAHAEETRIGGGTPLHYLIADATGAAATIEYLNGGLVVHTGSSLPTANLTNDSYERSVAHLNRQRSMPSGASSLDRFARTAMLMRENAPTASVDRAFEILDRVVQRGSTRWSIVYDARRREISWITDMTRARKTLRMNALDLDCSAAPKMLDVHSRFAGDVTASMDDYSPGVNRQLVLSSYATTSFTREQPLSWAEADAMHADSVDCAGSRKRATRK